MPSKAAPSGRKGRPYKMNTCQEQGLILRNVGSVVVEPGKRATDVEEGVGVQTASPTGQKITILDLPLMDGQIISPGWDEISSC